MPIASTLKSAHGPKSTTTYAKHSRQHEQRTQKLSCIIMITNTLQRQGNMKAKMIVFTSLSKNSKTRVAQSMVLDFKAMWTLPMRTVIFNPFVNPCRTLLNLVWRFRSQRLMSGATNGGTKAARPTLGRRRIS